MDKKLLVGFELCIDINFNLVNNHDINIDLLNKIRSFSQEYFNVRHTIYVESDKIQIFCITKTTEVPLRSRGGDEISKGLVKLVQEKYFDMFFYKRCRHIIFQINPLYFIVKDGDFFTYKHNRLYKIAELSNTDLWYEYYSKFQYKVYTCYS